MKKAGWVWTRVETWVIPGFPDVLACDLDGRLHLVELKATVNNRINLSAHQTAFLTSYGRRRASVWLLVRQTKRDVCRWFLFAGEHASHVAIRGLDPEVAAGVWEGVEFPDEILACISRPSPRSVCLPPQTGGEKGHDAFDQQQLAAAEDVALCSEAWLDPDQRARRTKWGGEHRRRLADGR